MDKYLTLLLLFGGSTINNEFYALIPARSKELQIYTAMHYKQIENAPKNGIKAQNLRQ